MDTVDPLTAASKASYPSVSLLVPIDGETPWKSRLGCLHDDAVARLRSEFGPALDSRLTRRLSAAVADATAPRGARSIAVYVNCDVASVVGLGIEVRERVVVDDTFATRDLVATGLRQPSYWVLALNLSDPKLFHAHDGRLHPRPLNLPDVAAHPSTKRTGRGVDRRTASEIQRTRRTRVVDAAVTTALTDSSDPVVVVGADPTLSQFLARTRNIERVEAVVRRAPGTSADIIANVVAPAVAEMLTERRERALQNLDQAVSNGAASSGIEAVWRATRRSTPGLLIVEDGFEQPAQISSVGRFELAKDSTAPDVIDDVVDEIIEAVLAAGGRVEMTPAGVLADHQRIAFVPWERRRRR